MLWHIELKFCIWLCFTVLQIKFECLQFSLMFVEVMSLLEIRILKIHSFLHFSLSYFDRLSWNFAYDFLYASLQTGRIMVWRCPSVRVSVRPSIRPSQFSAIFSYMLWHIDLKFCVSLYCMHIRSSSNAINFRHFLQELCSFLTSNSYKYAVFRTFLLHALTYWVQILYMTLF